MNRIKITPHQQKIKLSPSVCQQLRAWGLFTFPSVSLARNLMFERGVYFHPGCTVTRTKIGAYSYCAPNTNLSCATIGRYCSIGHQVELGLTKINPHLATCSPALQPNQLFTSYTGPIASEEASPPSETSSQVTIGHYVWIGCNCLFPQDVTIGTGAVIGAGSIITHDVPPYAIVAGAGGGEQSRGIIKSYRFSDEIIADLIAMQWWRYDLPQMLARGAPLKLNQVSDFLAFFRHSAPEQLILLPENWFYLHVQTSNQVQIMRVDPNQSNMGSLTAPAELTLY